MTRAVGLALGAVAAALLASDAQLAELAPVLVAVLATVALGLRLLGRRPAARATAAAALGATFVLARVASGGGFAGGPSTPAALPAGEGPWAVRVVALAAPQEGSQRFTGSLDDGTGCGSISRRRAIRSCGPETVSKSRARFGHRRMTRTAPTLRGPASRQR